MKAFFIAILIAALALGVASDADAKKRFGGGKSTGMQRDAVKPTAPNSPTAPGANPTNPATPPSVAPAAAPAAAGAAAAAAAKPASGMSRWLGPLAGLAAGGLLASLFMGGAFAGLKMLDVLLMLGLAVGVFFVVRMFMRKAAENAGSNMQYQGAGSPIGQPAPAQAEPMAAPMERTSAPEVERQGGRIVAPEIGSGLSTANASPAVIEAATIAPRIPADFDLPPFERNARAAFIRMQAANDAGDLADIRDFTTPEMYAEVSLQIQERGAVKQVTEIVSLNVRVLEVITDPERAIASVRYTGVLREDGTNDGFDEVWHVVKNLTDNNATWRIAGVQQLDA